MKNPRCWFKKNKRKRNSTAILQKNPECFNWHEQKSADQQRDLTTKREEKNMIWYSMM